MLRPNSRSCRTASIRSGRAGGLAGELWILCRGRVFIASWHGMAGMFVFAVYDARIQVASA